MKDNKHGIRQKIYLNHKQKTRFNILNLDIREYSKDSKSIVLLNDPV